MPNNRPLTRSQTQKNEDSRIQSPNQTTSFSKTPEETNPWYQETLSRTDKAKEPGDQSGNARNTDPFATRSRLHHSPETTSTLVFEDPKEGDIYSSTLLGQDELGGNPDSCI
ncbi:hypothetical protein QAD02_002414 [Eretmocerus hayati]|uniref:Uncharacterized protein n=1 Tax=Eretmocerus hayati TaxID=131215 RepID=A0ACC2NIU3_9HYME|nr:hypothetical protein QAD02_002414 [Eretmocerus hayati]